MGLLLAVSAIGGALGAAVASFSNVVSDRLARGESILAPPSHCHACGAPVRPCDNVPVLSWLVLRGACRACGDAIPLRVFAVEVAGTLLGAATAAALLLGAG